MSNYIINLLPEDFREPPVYFYTASSRYEQNTMRYLPGAQNFYQILLVLEGTGVLHCGGSTYPLQPGCAFFTATGVPSEYINTGGLVTAFLTARGDGMPGLLRHYGCGDFLFTQRCSPEPFCDGIDRVIREYYKHKREGLLSAMVYSFFVDFFESFRTPAGGVIARTCLYIEKHFTRKLTLDGLAAVSGISVSKLCHDFKRDCGCTVFDYILNLRLTYARSFLYASRDARAKDAALSCGFEDISYFCRAYKRKFGVSPAQDRAAHFR